MNKPEMLEQAKKFREQRQAAGGGWIADPQDEAIAELYEAVAALMPGEGNPEPKTFAAMKMAFEGSQRGLSKVMSELREARERIAELEKRLAAKAAGGKKLAALVLRDRMVDNKSYLDVAQERLQLVGDWQQICRQLSEIASTPDPPPQKGDEWAETLIAANEVYVGDWNAPPPLARETVKKIMDRVLEMGRCDSNKPCDVCDELQNEIRALLEGHLPKEPK